MSNTKLEIVMGPMFSGKTTYIIEFIDKLEKENVKYLALKPMLDERYSTENYIISHNQKKKSVKYLLI